MLRRRAGRRIAISTDVSVTRKFTTERPDIVANGPERGLACFSFHAVPASPTEYQQIG